MKIQPIHIDDLTKFIRLVIKKDLKGEFNLCGEKIITMKELFGYVFDSFNKKPIIIETPKIFFKPILPLLEKMKIITKEEYLMIEDNICSHNDAEKYLGELKNATKI
jgi:NADH dehydrogenase